VDQLLGLVGAPTTEGVRHPELGASRWAAAAMTVPTASTTRGPPFDRLWRVDEHGQAAYWCSQWICDVSAPLAQELVKQRIKSLGTLQRQPHLSTGRTDLDRDIEKHDTGQNRRGSTCKHPAAASSLRSTDPASISPAVRY
jgi:hypothetical protein